MTSETGIRSVFGCIPRGVALARIAPFSGWNLANSSKCLTSPATAQARDFALSFGQHQESGPVSLNFYLLALSIFLPKSMSKTTTRAPLLLAPNAKALPAPPAPTSTNNLPFSGESKDALPLVYF